MPNYSSWNRAITEYFLAGIPKGNPVFLSVDTESLEDTLKFIDTEAVIENPVTDFTNAVQEACLWRDRVSIDRFKKDTDGIPNSVGFLSLLVLAATIMKQDDDNSEHAYLIRLRQLLGLPEEHKRPKGFAAGDEIPLWNAWNQFLTSKGMVSTAKQWGEGRNKNIGYSRSQTILRDGDKDYLKRFIRNNNLPGNLDTDQLGFEMGRLSRTSPQFRRALREGFNHSSPNRRWEYYSATHRLYESVIDQELPNDLQSGSTKGSANIIESGLYRAESFTGPATYHLFPRQPSRSLLREINVFQSSSSEPVHLPLLREGFFKPAWEQNPFVDTAEDYTLEDSTESRCVRFPNRNYWVLVREAEHSLGAWASWKRYIDLGEHFILLCRTEKYDKEIQRYKEANLLDWDKRIEHSNWVEYQGCMVLSYEWGAFIPSEDCNDLAETLTPRSIANISLSAGLKDPHQNAWIEGYLPELTLFGFDKEFNVEIVNAHGDLVFSEFVEQQKCTPIPDLPPNQYVITASKKGNANTQETQLATKRMTVIGWNQVQEHPSPQHIINTQIRSTAGLSLKGPLIIESKSTNEERI